MDDKEIDIYMGFLGEVGSYIYIYRLSGVVKKLPANAEGTGLTSGLGRSPGGGHSHPLQYSCMGNHTDKGAWRVTVHEVTEELDTT